MTRDDIIRMARHAGMFKLFNDPNAPDALIGESIEQFAALVAKHEREACAKSIESRKSGANELMDAVRDMEAQAIRERGEKNK
jgi:hypothetical protein